MGEPIAGNSVDTIKYYLDKIKEYKQDLQNAIIEKAGETSTPIIPHYAPFRYLPNAISNIPSGGVDGVTIENFKEWIQNIEAVIIRDNIKLQKLSGDDPTRYFNLRLLRLTASLIARGVEFGQEIESSEINPPPVFEVPIGSLGVIQNTNALVQMIRMTFTYNEDGSIASATSTYKVINPTTTSFGSMSPLSTQRLNMNSGYKGFIGDISTLNEEYFRDAFLNQTGVNKVLLKSYENVERFKIMCISVKGNRGNNDNLSEIIEDMNYFKKQLRITINEIDNDSQDPDNPHPSVLPDGEPFTYYPTAIINLNPATEVTGEGISEVYTNNDQFDGDGSLRPLTVKTIGYKQFNKQLSTFFVAYGYGAREFSYSISDASRPMLGDYLIDDKRNFGQVVASTADSTTIKIYTSTFIQTDLAYGSLMNDRSDPQDLYSNPGFLAYMGDFNQRPSAYMYESLGILLQKIYNDTKYALQIMDTVNTSSSDSQLTNFDD